MIDKCKMIAVCILIPGRVVTVLIDGHYTSVLQLALGIPSALHLENLAPAVYRRQAMI